MLAELARGGSRPAFEALVLRYRPSLLSYCRRLLTPEHAEDVVQKTFLDAHAAFQRGEVVLRPRAWLYRIAHNAALNARRDRFSAHEPLEESLAVTLAPFDELEARERLAAMLAAVRALPPRQRRVFVLRELEGRTYGEIAGELGISAGAVRQLLHRARRAVRAA